MHFLTPRALQSIVATLRTQAINTHIVISAAGVVYHLIEDSEEVLEENKKIGRQWSKTTTGADLRLAVEAHRLRLQKAIKSQLFESIETTGFTIHPEHLHKNAHAVAPLQ
eukprot:XP_001707334.1 Hypothetical protein GL50803_34383 [Giardia lamblia ATCC 50803]